MINTTATQHFGDLVMNNAIFFNLDTLSLRTPRNFKETSLNEPAFERPVPPSATS